MLLLYFIIQVFHKNYCEAKKRLLVDVEVKYLILEIRILDRGRGIRAAEARRRTLKQVIFIGFAPPPSRHKSQPFRTILH